MTPEELQVYDRLRERLRIDYLRIDEEVASMSQLIQEAAELSVAASDAEAAAKATLEVVSAEAAARLRAVGHGEKAKSDTQISRELPLEDDVQEAQLFLARARTDAALWKVLVGSMQDKSQILRKGCELIISGFITPSSYRPGRAELMRRKE